MADDLDAALAGLSQALAGAAMQHCTDAAAGVILARAQVLAPVDSGSMREHLGIVSHHTQHSATSGVQVADSAPGGSEHAAIFLEYGTVNMPARPFMRPAFESTKAQALAAFEAALQANLKPFTTP